LCKYLLKLLDSNSAAFVEIFSAFLFIRTNN
jgi:hypothetical protein